MMGHADGGEVLAATLETYTEVANGRRVDVFGKTVFPAKNFGATDPLCELFNKVYPGHGLRSSRREELAVAVLIITSTPAHALSYGDEACCKWRCFVVLVVSFVERGVWQLLRTVCLFLSVSHGRVNVDITAGGREVKFSPILHAIQRTSLACTRSSVKREKGRSTRAQAYFIFCIFQQRGYR